MNDLTDLIVAVTKVEGAVTGLQVAFEKKTITDALRFEKIEGNVEKHASVLAAHAELHMSHARLITKANELAIAAVEKAEAVRTEAQTALKLALDTHATDTSNKLDGIAKSQANLALDGKKRAELLDKVITWQKHPYFRAAWIVGAFLGGVIAAWYTANH